MIFLCKNVPCAWYWTIIFALKLMQGCKESVLFLQSWFVCAKASVHLCTFPFQESVTRLWGFYSSEKCVCLLFVCFSPLPPPRVVQKFGWWFQMPFKIYLKSPWWLWWSCTKGKEMPTKLFIQMKLFGRVFLLSSCVNERGPKEKTVLEADENHQPDCRRGEVTKIFISTRLENNTC